MAIREQVIKKSALSPTILVAGGAGFIGSHLAHALLARDARVIVLDNFKTGKDVYVSSLVKNPKFAFFDVDINQGIPSNIQSVDYIVHLAGVESYLYSRDVVNLDSLLTNAVGTKNLLDLAKKSEAKFLLVSSVDVYQGILSPVDLEFYFGKTQEEETKYSLSEAKRFAEALVWEYYKNNHTDVRIARLPEVYGPRMNLTSSGNLGRLVGQILENKNLVIEGEGTEKEFYLYISDVVSGLVKSLFGNKTAGKIFTLAPDEPHAVLEIAYLLKSLADREVEIKFKHREAGPLKATKIPDKGSLEIIKWEPKVEFKPGLSKTLEWFGYETNEHTFKPNKLVEKKKTEKATKRGQIISSLIEEASPIATKTLSQPLIDKPIVEKEKKKSLFSKKTKKKEKIDPSKKVFKKAPRKPKSKKITPAIIAAVVAALLLFTAVPFLQAFVNAKLAYSTISRLPDAFEQMDSKLAQKQANNAFQKFYRSQKALKRGSWITTLLKKEEAANSTLALLSSATHFSRGLYYTAKASPPFLTLWEMIKPNSKETFDKNSFSEAEINLNEAKNSLQQALAEYKRVRVENLPSNVRPQTQQYESFLKNSVGLIDTASVLASDIPNLLGADGITKKYMVLFQNSHEVRPTGGFIGSYAIVEIKDGKIVTLTIDDVYNPDGQIDLKDIQNPPIPVISGLLNEDRAYIRNANWNPSFPESAKDIRDLYFQITGADVDGVIAIDLLFAENILSVTGPIFLTAFGEEISAKNLYERAQYHSGFNYESGSGSKRAFLTIFGGKLMEAVFALPKDKIPDLIKEVGKSLEEKHLLISLTSSPFGSKLSENGWDGDLIRVENSDYIYVVNANVGGTKANYFVKNKMEYTVTSQTRDGLLRGILTLNYNHTGTDNAWPGGPYKDYVRVLTQNGSKLTGATISHDGAQAQDIFEEIVIDRAGNYNSFETLFELKPQQRVTLTFYYDLPQALSITQANQEYNLYWQKQPGTKGDPVVFRFEPPFGMKTNGESQISSGTSLTVNKILSIELE